MTWLSSLGAKVIAIIALGVLVVGLAWFGLAQWQKSRTAATESRVEHAQSTATVESAKDAIATQAAANERQAASEDLTRQNEKDIRNAEGSADPVKPAVRDAGLRAVCRRDAYSNSERCRVFIATPSVVEKAR